MGQTASPAITQTHFEVYVLESDRWTIGYVSTSREEALEEASELVRRPEIAGVRVVRELFNPATEATAARIVFERLRPKRKGPRGPAAVARSRPSPATPAAPKPAASAQRAVVESGSDSFSWSSLAGLSVIGAVAGGGLAIILALLAAP